MATIIARPDAPTKTLESTWQTPPGFLGELSSVDHKTIGKRYIVTAFVFLVIGGIEAAIMRLQLAHGNSHLLTPEAYDQLFTMHGITMIFLFASPILSGFSNFLWPLMMGARDMAYPRVNALSYWTYLFAGLFIYSSVIIGQSPDGGWFNYVPMTGRAFSPGHNIDFYALGLIFLGISTTFGAINFIGTFFNVRSPGMSINRVPIIVWGTLTASFSVVAFVPALTVACTELWLDRNLGTHFFDPANAGHPMLWQHLFWIFGHPWVYIVVLPAMGMASDLIPAFARRPLAGYTYVAMATVATGIIGSGVWIHHMFATGIPQPATSFFSAASMVIAIPSGVSILAWIATIWHGRPVFKTPMLFIGGFIFLFVMGGVSGVMTASVPFDWQLTDTYFIVAHLHYVLLGINVFPVMAALYYWFPKMTGRMLHEQTGRWIFWLMFIGVNVAFFPMHIAGMLGMPRRVYTYPAGIGWDAVGMIETIGAFTIVLGVLIFIIDVFRSYRSGTIAGDNPWDGPTLEWSVSSPPPPYNFAVLPTVRSPHPMWEERLGERPTSVLDRGPALDEGRETTKTTGLDADPVGVLIMPKDSYAPLLLALAMSIVFATLLVHAWIGVAVGVCCMLAVVIGWLWP